MLHINARDGLTIAVSESPNVSQVAKRTVLSTSALAVLAPILEEMAGWSAIGFGHSSKRTNADSGMGAGANRLAYRGRRRPTRGSGYRQEGVKAEGWRTART